MKNTLVFPVIATVCLSSCSLPWKNEAVPSPLVLPERIVTFPEENTGSGNVPLVQSGSVTESGAVTESGSQTVTPEPATTGSSESAATGTLEDVEVRETLKELDRLFDGIAGDEGPSKK